MALPEGMLAGTISVRGREGKDEQETARVNPSGDYVDWCSQDEARSPRQRLGKFGAIAGNVTFLQTIYSIDIIIGADEYE